MAAGCQVCYGRDVKFMNCSVEWNGANGVDSITYFNCSFCGQYGISARFLLSPLVTPAQEEVACILYANRLHKGEPYIIVPNADEGVIAENIHKKQYSGNVKTVALIIKQFPRFPNELHDLAMANLGAMKDLDGHPLESVKIGWTQDYAALYANHKGGLEFQKVAAILQSKGWIIFHRGGPMYVMDKNHPSTQMQKTGIEITEKGWEKIRDLDTESTQKDRKMAQKIFIVHGRDLDKRDDIELFIRRIGLEPIILDQQPNSGRTVIEKFEEEQEAAKFAVIILTPDDRGGLKGAKKYNARARQNVIFEYGYFAGRLGRANVAALAFGDIERPSDIGGIVYAHEGSWQKELVKDLRAAGYDIDFDGVLK